MKTIGSPGTANVLRWVWFALLGWGVGIAGGSALRAADVTPVRREWTVDGVKREGLVAVPAEAKTKSVPVIFAFHGHGGNMRQAARSFAYHSLWPEALVVYLQGLNTPGKLTDPEGKRPGWQPGRGDQGDRDLKFFDAVLADLGREFRLDATRIYATGHSNGGSFTYLLWAERGGVLAAVAPSGAAAPAMLERLKPKPALHVAGEADPLVKFAWQRHTIAAVLKLNRCDEGKPWPQGGVFHASPIGAPVVVWTHAGGHEFPTAARPAIVAFFQSQRRAGQ